MWEIKYLDSTIPVDFVGTNKSSQKSMIIFADDQAHQVDTDRLQNSPSGETLQVGNFQVPYPVKSPNKHQTFYRINDNFTEVIPVVYTGAGSDVQRAKLGQFFETKEQAIAFWSAIEFMVKRG